MINVEWKPADEKFLHGILRGYKVRYREHSQAAFTNWTVKTITHDTLRTELVNLKPGTMYGVQVSAFTIKDGVWSETVMAKTQLRRRFNLRNNVLFLEKTTHEWSHKLEKNTDTHTGRKMQQTKCIHYPTRFERITSQILSYDMTCEEHAICTVHVFGPAMWQVHFIEIIKDGKF